MKKLSKKNQKKGENSLTIAAIISFVLTLLILFLVLKLNTFIALFCGVFNSFFFGKIYFMMTRHQGWKTFQKKAFLGMPVSLLVYYSAIIALFTMLFFLNQNGPQDQTRNIFLGFVVAGGIAIITTFIMWYAGVAKWMGMDVSI